MTAKPCPIDDSAPRFPHSSSARGTPRVDDLMTYVKAVLARMDPSARFTDTPCPATDRLMERLGADRLPPARRPAPSDWWGFLHDRLEKAPTTAAKAIRAWGEETLLAALKNSAQADESTPRIDDFDAILDAVDDAKLDAEQKRTLERLKLASKRNWVQHHSAWEGFEQIIVPLPPLEEVFEAGRNYSIGQAAKSVGVSEATIRGRIKAQRLKATKSKVGTRISGAELNRALAAGEFNADPRGSTAQSD